jgi:hypothetical protein
MKITKTNRIVPVQVFNGKTYCQYEGRYFTNGTKKMHREVWSFYNGDIPKGHHIHHIDGDVTNNDISNLQLMEARTHLIMEGKKRHKDNPEWSKQFYTKGIEMAKEWHKSPEGLEWHRQNGISAYAKRQPVLRICLMCKKEYKTTQLGNTKFCSNNCKSANRKASGIDDVKRNCIICNTEFTCNKYAPQTKCKRGCK